MADVISVDRGHEHVFHGGAGVLEGSSFQEIYEATSIKGAERSQKGFYANITPHPMTVPFPLGDSDLNGENVFTSLSLTSDISTTLTNALFGRLDQASSAFFSVCYLVCLRNRNLHLQILLCLLTIVYFCVQVTRLLGFFHGRLNQTFLNVYEL